MPSLSPPPHNHAITPASFPSLHTTIPITITTTSPHYGGDAAEGDAGAGGDREEPQPEPVDMAAMVSFPCFNIQFSSASAVIYALPVFTIITDVIMVKCDRVYKSLNSQMCVLN